VSEGCIRLLTAAPSCPACQELRRLADHIMQCLDSEPLAFATQDTKKSEILLPEGSSTAWCVKTAQIALQPWRT
jgi:hypothetical protein